MQIPCHLKQARLWKKLFPWPLASRLAYGCLIFSVLMLEPAVLTITSWVPRAQAAFKNAYDSMHKAQQGTVFWHTQRTKY